jgi:glycosyltransferase involved in cell wall biosynthesis
MRGGPSFVIRTMARCQARHGICVDVACTDDNGEGRLDVPRNLPVKDDNVTYWFFSRQTHFYTFSSGLTLWLWQHSAKYDVIHIHALFSYPSIAAAVCAWVASVPYVLRPLGTLNQWGMRYRRQWLKYISFRFIESRILSCAAAVQYTSEQEAAEAKLLGVPHRPVTVPNPVELPDLLRFRGGFRARHKSLEGCLAILFLSRLDPKKGLDLLLPAFSKVRDRHPAVVLIIAGEGNPAFVTALHQDAQRLGLSTHIVWSGFLQGEEKLAALADADLFVLPSYSENFGVAAVEAMGAGLPVVVSDQVGIHREISRAEAGLVVECSIDSLATALTQAVGDAGWRRKTAKRARALARKFEPDIVTEHLVELYDQIRKKDGTPKAA